MPTPAPAAATRGHAPKGAAVLAILMLSPLINVLINRTLDRSWHLQSSEKLSVGPGHWLFTMSGLLVMAIAAVLLLWTLWRYQHPGRRARRLLELLGVITTLQALLNGALVLIAISSLKLGSMALLLIGAGIYAVLNAIALFWYWCLDHPGFGSGLSDPTQLRQGGVERRGLIVFPEGLSATICVVDYLFFTVISSNTLGPPENHTVVGHEAKLLQLAQSTMMLVLLVIVVARAINTLG